MVTRLLNKTVVILLCLILVGQSMASFHMLYAMVSMSATSSAPTIKAMSQSPTVHSNHHTMAAMMPVNHHANPQVNNKGCNDTPTSSVDCCAQQCDCLTSLCSALSALPSTMQQSIPVATVIPIALPYLLLTSQDFSVHFRPPIFS